MTTNPARVGVYFGKLEYHPEKYNDTLLYLNSQPLNKRKLGFGTHDASKKDEFTLTLATERYREHMKIESDIDIKQCEKTGELPEDPYKITYKLQEHPKDDYLYDYGKEKVTKECYKCHREMNYCKHEHTNEKVFFYYI